MNHKYYTASLVASLLWMAAWPLSAPAQPTNVSELAKFHRALGYVTVTVNGPADGGDFGPKTPGTKTAGIQEALDYARQLKDPNWAGGAWAAKNVCIGRGMYTTAAPIRIPWMGECWYLEARQAVIAYTGTNGSAVEIDSMMNCELRFGYILAQSLKGGAAVLVKPHTPFPEAPRGVFTLSTFSCLAICGGGQVVESTQIPTGIGLLLDASSGPIIEAQFIVSEINACDISLVADCPQGGGGILWNTFLMQFNHLSNVGMILGKEGPNVVRHNQVTVLNEQKRASFINGQNNIITLIDNTTRQGDLDLILGPEARDNIIHATALAKGVQDRSASGANHLVLNGPLGLGLKTPPVPESGQTLTNRTAMAVDVFITSPGKVENWELGDTNCRKVSFVGGLSTGQCFRLNPGESVSMKYSEPPKWSWKGL